MLVNTSIKTCLCCSKSLKGRADKKFCDDYCRNAFNNGLKARDNNFIRNINNALLKNRRLLKAFLANGDKMVKIKRDKLLHQQFQFNYHTHTYTNQKGNTYFFCYEYGYLALENDWLLIVHKKDGEGGN